MAGESGMQRKARVVGINHVALVVGDIEQALDFYGRIFDFELRGRGKKSAFLDMGDQFIALMEGPPESVDQARHFGLVVDDKARVRERLGAAGADVLPGRSLDFRDPWGNRVQIVEYRNIQFTKAPHVLEGMGLRALDKTAEALEQLARKGMTPPVREP